MSGASACTGRIEASDEAVTRSNPLFTVLPNCEIP